MSKRRGLPERTQMRADAHFVDQLFKPQELTFGRRIPITLIEANPDQPRSVLGDLSDLKQSILEKGVLEPILVRPRDDGRYTIISGERRFRASFEAGLSEVPCIEMDVADAELLEIALIENLQRKDLTPFEEADGYLALREKHQYTHEQIAKAVGKSRVTVTETLSFATLPQRVKDECRRADIQSKSFLLQLSRLELEEEMLAQIEAYGRGESNRDSLRDLRRKEADEEQSASSSRPNLRKAYELTYQPAERPFRLSLVLKGDVSSREEVLAAVGELLDRIQSGAVDLERHGRFSRTPKTGIKK